MFEAGRRRWLWAVFAGAALLAARPARAAGPALIGAARKEGTVVWYSGLIVNQIGRKRSRWRRTAARRRG